MKRIILVLLALVLFVSVSLAESISISLQSLSDDELETLIENAQLELNRRKEMPVASYEWREEDFVFYDNSGKIILQPTSGTDILAGWISLEKAANGRTYRGLKLGDYPETVKSLYDFADASWDIRDTVEGKYGTSDREKELTQKWTELGYTGNDLLEQVPFLTSKGYGFLLQLSIYKEDGVFKTESQITYSGLDNDAIENDVQRIMTSDSYSGTPEEKIRTDCMDYYKGRYRREHRRATFMVSIFSGCVHAVELTDYYYDDLDKVYKDDGSIDEEYAYILDLK